jgi:tetratricopeptide (TPR) repeat protein
MPNYRGRALAWHDEGERLRAEGQDPSEAFQAAIADYDAALSMMTVREDILAGRAGARVNWAIHKAACGEAPTALLEAAIGDLDQALAMNRDWVELFLRRAAARHNLGNWSNAAAAWDAAELDYAEAIRIEPTRTDAWLGRGQLRSKRSRFREALEDFEQALNLEPLRAEVYQRRAEARMNQANHSADPEEAYRLAERDGAEAERLDPTSAEIRTGVGALHLNRGHHESTQRRDPVLHYEKAIAAFDRALAINPRYAPAMAYRAQARTNWGVWVRQKGGDPAALYELAVADYGQALAVDGSRSDVWVRRGDLKVNRAIASQRTSDPSDHYRSALADFAEASKRTAGHAGAAASSANARGAWLDWLKRSGRGEEAERVYREFKAWLATAPATAEVRWRAGVCHQVMEAWREAVDAYVEAVRMDESLELKLKAKIELCRSKMK